MCTNATLATQFHNLISAKVFITTAPANVMLALITATTFFSSTALMWTSTPPLLSYGHFNCCRQGSISIATWVALAMFL